MGQISEATAKNVNRLLMGRSWKVKGKLRNEKLWYHVLYTLKVIMKIMKLYLIGRLEDQSTT